MSSIRLVPLGGCRSDSSTGRCYVLEIDSVKIVLDVGCALLTMDCSHLEQYVQRNRISAVLISHGDVSHCGGLVSLCAVLARNAGPETPTIFATTPVQHLGRQALLDARAAWKGRFGTAPAALSSLNAIEAAFDRIKCLRYSQPVPLLNAASSFQSSGEGITVMAMPAGHSLGGAMWRIRKASGEDIIYAVDFDHRRGTCLDGAAFDLLSRPTCLIVDCQQALVVGEARKDRDAALFAHLKLLLSPTSGSAGKTIIIPVESASVSLELLYMFERWAADTRPPVSLYFHTLGNPQRTVDYAKGMLEWMGPGMMKAFDVNRENPFDLKHVRICHKLTDIHQGASGHRIILASMPHFACGPSLQLLMQYASSSSAHVLLLESPPPNSVAFSLMSNTSSEVSVSVCESVPLEGIELIKYRKEQQALKEQQQAEANFRKMQHKRSVLAEDGEGEEEEEEEDDDNDEDTQVAEDPTKAKQESEIESVRALREIYWSDYKTDWWYSACINSALLQDPFKLPKGRFQVFTAKHSRAVQSDYGHVVPPDMFSSSSSSVLSSSYQPAPLPEDAVNLASQARQLILKKKEEEEEPTEPVKWVVVHRKLSIKCQRKVFPGFNNLSDGRSLRNIIGQIAPRRLILVGGNAESTDYLYNHFLYSTISSASFTLNQVLAPRIGEAVELSSSVATVPASLSESLTESIKILRCADYQIARLLGTLSVESDDPASAEHSLMKIEPIAKHGGVHKMDPIMIGDVKMGEFRKLVMETLGIPAEFLRGDLVIGWGEHHRPQILVRKMDEAGWLFEGEQSAEFDALRDLFYGQLAIV